MDLSGSFALPSAASLENLPPELMDDVLRHLSRRDKSRLSKVSKAIFKKSLESLYRDIRILWMRGSIYSGTNISPGFGLLLRTLLETPSLAEYIRTVSLESKDFYGLQDNGSTCVRAPHLPSIATSSEVVMEPMSDDTALQIQKLAVQGDIFAAVALFVWVCPKLVSVGLGIAVVWGNPFLSQLLLNNWKSSESVRSIRLGADLRNMTHDLEGISELPASDHIEPYLKLLCQCPRLERFALHHATNTPNGEVGGVFDGTSFTNITTLYLPEAEISEAMLKTVLSLCPSLTNLYYSQGVRGRFAFLDCAALMSALSISKDQLTHLRLHCSCYSDYIFGIAGPSTPEVMIRGKCSFHDFSSLTSLQCSMNLLLGWDSNIHCWPEPTWTQRAYAFWESLPPNLEQLVIHEDFFFVYYRRGLTSFSVRFFIEAFKVRGWRDFVPKLRCLNIDQDSSLSRRLDLRNAGYQILKDACEQHGLAFELIDADQDWTFH